MTAAGDHQATQGFTAGAEVRETHSAVVLLVGDRVYKIKKAVDLGFLDFRSEQARREVTRHEVALNRRLAPDVYLDAITVAGSEGRTYEYGLVMRRMPEALRLSTMIGKGVAVDDHLRALARLIARFHATADRSPQIAAEGSSAALHSRWEDNLRESEQFRGTLLAAPTHDQISALALRYVDGRDSLLAERASAGLIVDGHGDLIAEDVFCLPDHPRVLDCLEFDDRLRWLDVLDDVAFLAMDLEYLGRPDLATHFLGCYHEYSRTPQVASLRHHYIAYRAFVRAKVLCIQVTQGRASAAAEAERYAGIALQHLKAGEVRLVLVGGAPGSGKSTLARGLADRLGAVLLSSDVIRRSVPPAGPQRYSDSAKEFTYRELLARAEHALRHGESVVADATWGDPTMRQLAAGMAAETASTEVALECSVPLEVAAARAERRLSFGEDPSEADAAVARSLAAARAPWPGATIIETSGRVAESLERAVAAISRIKVPHD